jgi:hypothetical protein
MNIRCKYLSILEIDYCCTDSLKLEKYAGFFEHAFRMLFLEDLYVEAISYYK